MSSLEAANLFSVKGMVIVITGGGSGLGAMMAHALDINGASKIYILGRRLASLEKVAAAAKNHSIIPIVTDVTSKSSLSAAVSQIEKETPFINVLLSNAGIAGPADALTGKYTSSPPTLSEFQAHLWSTSSSAANSVSEINVMASYFTFLAFLPLLSASNTHPDSIGKNGRIPAQFVSTSSIAGFSRSNMLGFPYSASKAALTHLTKMISTEFAAYGVRANALVPGFWVTEGTEFMVEGLEGDLTLPGSLPKEVNPAQRAGSEEDIAGAILYLVSRAGGFVNGATLLTDGGAISVRPATY